MAMQRRFRSIPLFLLTVVVSMIGCVEQGPQGEQGATGPPGQPGEVVTITTPPPDVAPLPSEVGLTTRQAQPRISFDPAALPAGIPQVEVVPGSPARVTVAFRLTDDNGTPIDRSVLDALRFTLSHLDVEPQTGLTHWVSDILRTQRSTITGITVTQPNDENNTPTSSTGTFIALGNGVYRYTFATRLPEGFDPNKTYRICVQARRTPVPGRSFVDNATLDFRP